MERNSIVDIIGNLPTPVFAVDRSLLEHNARILDGVRRKSGAKILLALKAFSMFSTFGLLRDYLDGICASSPHEARLGKEEFGREVHSFAAAFGSGDYREIERYSDHIVFNSMAQYEKYYRTGSAITYGLRINPEHCEAEVPLYDPCAPYSRLGIPSRHMPTTLPEGISGLHFHTLCEQDSFALERTFRAVELKFGRLFGQCEWLNLGGGHHITREGYDIEHLCSIISHIRRTYGCGVYLEPGEAVALNTGYLAATVLDIVENGMEIAILDTSAAAHTPDVLEMPYRPHVTGSGMPKEKEYTYRLAGLSCLAGDVFGDYSFDRPLSVGDRVVFTDMAIYSMVKTNTFNGLSLPDIVYFDSTTKEILHTKTFGYSDFKERLS
ncbi:MAG: carboxynorspermidine decarboxylase [Spirochaetota bacterium]